MRYETARLADFSVLEQRERKAPLDQPFLLTVLLLLGFGVIMVLSASFPRAYYDPGHVTGGSATYYFVRQLIFAAAGVGAMLFAARLPISFYRRTAPYFMLLTLALLALVPFIGVRANGSRRWLGAALALLLFAALILRGYRIALQCRDSFGALVVAGITTQLALQVFLNVAVVTNLLPCTGISLPFFSYGGTALIIQLAEMGIVLSASRDIMERDGV